LDIIIHGATYSLYCQDELFISRQEYKAMKWSFYTLVPFQNLRRAILNGKTNILSLSEYFDVTIDFMSKCISFYLEKYGQIITKEEMLQVSI